MSYPTRTSYAWIGHIKRTSFPALLAVLLGVYIAIDFAFGGLYQFVGVLDAQKVTSFFDYYYFSFVTSLTIGFGDFTPVTSFGKVLVITHGCLTAIYFAFMIAVLSAKIFYPKNTMMFAKKLCFVPGGGNEVGVIGSFNLRLINTHKEKLINPEIRVFVVEHAVGNVIARNHKAAKFDDKPYLGRHDFIFGFTDSMRLDDAGHIQSIYQQWLIAKHHDDQASGGPKSRFKISVSVVGNYGMQQAAFVKEYYPCDIQVGRGFKPIQYNENDQRKGNMRYSDFENFWEDFETILPIPNQAPTPA